MCRQLHPVSGSFFVKVSIFGYLPPMGHGDKKTTNTSISQKMTLIPVAINDKLSTNTIFRATKYKGCSSPIGNELHATCVALSMMMWLPS